MAECLPFRHVRIDSASTEIGHIRHNGRPIHGRRLLLLFENIRDVHGGERTKRVPSRSRRVMVERHGFHDRIAQAPCSKQVSTNLGMRGAEHLSFSIPFGHALILHQSQRLRILVRHVGG